MTTSSAGFVAVAVFLTGVTQADERVRSEVIKAYGDTTGVYQRQLAAKRVSATFRQYGYQSGKFVDLLKFDLWHNDERVRLDLLTTDSAASELINFKISYVMNDYFPFTVRSFPKSPYTIIASGRKSVSMGLEVNTTPAICGYCVEGQPLDEFFKWDKLTCISLQSDMWRGQPCSRFRGELRRPNGQLVWWVHIYYVTGDAARGAGWRSIGYQFGGRNNRDKKPRVDEYVIAYDDAKSHYVPSNVKYIELTESDKTAPPLLREEFDLVSVTDDPKPRSFFTLSEFGLPEPIGMDGPTPFYRRSWFFALLSGLAVVIGGGYYLRRRKRLGASDAA